MTTRDVAYHGKITACHTQALLTAYASLLPGIDAWRFEALSTVPFGLVSVAGDPNRLLTCYLDPDRGLDRALDALGVGYEVRAWPADVDAGEPLAALRAWCANGPVVLGPVNMDGLGYLFHPELYGGSDHYVVALRAGRRSVWLCDPEGLARVVLSPGELAAAWRGERIPEGRGAFVMRRVRGQVGALAAHADYHALRLGLANLRGARTRPRGGASAYLALAGESKRLMADPSLRRGLSFVLPTRMQRSACLRRFFRGLDSAEPQRTLVTHAVAVLEEQGALLADAVADLLERRPDALRVLERGGVLEEELTRVCERLEGGG